jgi:hypothetical protein
VVSFTLRPLHPQGKSPRCPRAVLDDVESNSDLYAVQPVASLYTDWDIPAPLLIPYKPEYTATPYFSNEKIRG